MAEKLEGHTDAISASLWNMWKGIRETIIDATSISIEKEKRERNSEWFDEECREIMTQKKQRM